MIEKSQLAGPKFYVSDPGEHEQAGIDRYPEDREGRLCHVCGHGLLRDEFPPNYWSSMGGQSGYTQTGSQKYICLYCEAEFAVSYSEVVTYGETTITERSETIGEMEKLVLRNGVYMNAFEMWQQDYIDEHGEAPNVAYG